ncbi:Succinate dehydrogenase flavoprotein subunit [Streptomyces misionensis JCM 4497]
MSSTIRGSSDARGGPPGVGRRRGRGRRRRAAGRDRGARAGRPYGGDLQVAVRQGAHGDGRGRHRGGDGQRQRARHLADALPRHDARRQVPQPVADGRAARAGGPAAGVGAGDLGCAVRPYEGRPDLAAQLRRSRVPAPRARRRPHRPGADPHPPAAGGRAATAGLRRHRGLRVRAQGLPGVHGDPGAEGWRAGRGQGGGGLRLRPGDRPLLRPPGPRGHPRHRRHRQVLQGHVELVGVHRRRSRAGAARGRAAAEHGVRAVPSDGHGLAAVGQGHPRHRVGARRRRRAQERGGRAVHVRLCPGRVQGQVRRVGAGGRRVVRRSGTPPPSARAAAPRRGGQGHQRRGEGGPGLPARRGLPGRLHADAGGGDPAAAAVHVPPVQGAGGRRHHGGADGGRADLPLRDGRCRRRLGHGGGARGAGAVRGRRGGGRHARLQPARRELPVGPAGVRSPRGPVRGRVRAGTGPKASAGERGAGRPGLGGGAAPLLRRGRGRGGADGEPVHPAPGAPADHERPGGHHPPGGRDGAGPAQARRAAVARRPDRHRGPPPVQPRLAPGPGPAEHAAGQRVCGAGGAGADGVARRPHPGGPPGDGPRLAQRQPAVHAGRAPPGPHPSRP